MAPCHVEDGSTSRKRHTAEEIVTKLRQGEVLTAQGRTVAEAIRSISVTEVVPQIGQYTYQLLGSEPDQALARAV